jgi:DNA invertase Pin-like site-specific DNA recombinase
MKAIIYIRTLTTNKKQSFKAQIKQLKEYAQVRKFEIVDVLIDDARTTLEESNGYQTIFKLAEAHTIDVILVWQYNWFVQSTKKLIQSLKEFQNLGIDFISYQDNIDTTSKQGKSIFKVISSLAKFENHLIGDRVRAGMVRAKSEGKRISRPRLSIIIQQQIASLYREKKSINQIRKELNISYGSAWNYVQKLKQST